MNKDIQYSNYYCNNLNKAIVDIRLRTRCVIVPLTPCTSLT